MRLHRLLTEPDSASDIRFIRGESLSVFTPKEIATELRAMRRHMKLPAKPDPTGNIEDGEWFEAVEQLSGSLGPALQGDTCSAWARTEEERIRLEVARRIRSILKAVQYASRVVDPNDSSATGLLLPTSFARRIQVLLGGAVLPVAWVRRLDLFSF